ncbi:MAG: bifunctional UDP-N-acetylglucosamine diphosphorylase/glucosamine-1-phosphate N-acetyltransferase GlmU [Pseudomonadota bacterium]
MSSASTDRKRTAPIAAVILAAGKGTRMKSHLPKVLHEVADLSLIEHVIRSVSIAKPERLVVVVGHEAEAVEARVRTAYPGAVTALQDPPMGTGHAAMQARAALEGFEGDVFILFGDTPLIRSATYARVVEAKAAANATLAVLGFHAVDPGAYGRLVTSADGELEAIVEAKDASPDQLAIRYCNSGVMCVEARALFRLLDKVEPRNAQGEYYLTDLVALARAEGGRCVAVAGEEAEMLGVNSRRDLAQAEAAFQDRARDAAMIEGVTLIAPQTVFFSHDTVLGRDVRVGPNVVFGPGVVVEDSVEIRAFSHLEGAVVASGAQIGPYARLRPGADIRSKARIGNFVEVKNAVFEEGAMANHLTYVGDAHVGADANIGAGTITCNYDGFLKHGTKIGRDAFVGSNSALVAPVEIGDGATVAAGSAITRDVSADALAVGRAQQVEKAGLAKKLRAKLAEAKAALLGRARDKS